MNIVVVGDGKVGYTLTASLSKEGHDVTVIDNRPDTLRNTTNELDVICIEGNGVSYAVQSEAGVQKADLLIAATSADEINMLACMVAKKLGAKHTIARVRDPQYQQQMFFLKEELGLSVVVNPEQSAASEISRLMRFVPAIKAEPFAKGRIDLVEFKVKENSPLDGVHGKYDVFLVDTGKGYKSVRLVQPFLAEQLVIRAIAVEYGGLGQQIEQLVAALFILLDYLYMYSCLY